MVFKVCLIFSMYSLGGLASLSSFFFNDTATTEIYTLSLHDALPICYWPSAAIGAPSLPSPRPATSADRKSTRLNSSHLGTSYAVFCLKTKKNKSSRSPPPRTQTPTQPHRPLLQQN